MSTRFDRDGNIIDDGYNDGFVERPSSRSLNDEELLDWLDRAPKGPSRRVRMAPPPQRAPEPPPRMSEEEQYGSRDAAMLADERELDSPYVDRVARMSRDLPPEQLYSEEPESPQGSYFDWDAHPSRAGLTSDERARYEQDLVTRQTIADAREHERGGSQFERARAGLARDLRSNPGGVAVTEREMEMDRFHRAKSGLERDLNSIYAGGGASPTEREQTLLSQAKKEQLQIRRELERERAKAAVKRPLPNTRAAEEADERSMIEKAAALWDGFTLSDDEKIDWGKALTSIPGRE